jgi:ferredoxin
VTRRDFLRAMQSQAIGLAATSLAERPVRTEEGGPSFRDLLEQRRESPKRVLLVECLKAFGSSVGITSADGLLAELDVTAQCTGCGVCATLCPTGAITARWTERDFVLGFRPWACTNCRVCVIVCGPRAIRPRKTTRLDSLLGTQEVPLLQARRATCRLCRDAFPANGSEICPLCAHQQGKQVAALHALFKERGPCVPRRHENASSTTASSQAST